MNNLEKILTDQEEYNKFMNFAKNNYFTAFEASHIIAQIKKSNVHLDKYKKLFEEQTDEMIKYFREDIIGTPGDSFGVAEIGLSSQFAKAFHEYITNKFNSNKFNKLIYYLVIGSIIDNNNYLLKSENPFTGRNMTIYLQNTIINNEILYSPQGNPYPAISFIMLTCPLIFFMVPYNDYPKYDLSILKSGIKLYETITNTIKQVLTELNISNIAVPKETTDDKVLLFEELTLDKLKDYYSNAHRFTNSKICELKFYNDGHGNTLESINIEANIDNGHIGHFGLDAIHLAIIMGKYGFGDDYKEYAPNYREKLLDYVKDKTNLSESPYVNIQLFTRIKLMYYEILKVCYYIVKSHITEKGFDPKITLSKEQKEAHEKLMKINENVIDEAEKLLESKINGYEKGSLKQIYVDFYSVWSGADYSRITQPLMIISDYGIDYIKLLEKIMDENYHSKISLRLYFFVIIIQYLMMKASKYNNIEIDVYRGIKDNSSTINDNNHEYNKNVIAENIPNINTEFLSDDTTGANKYQWINVVLYFMNNAYKIDPTGEDSQTKIKQYFNESLTRPRRYIDSSQKGRAADYVKEYHETHGDITDELIDEYIKFKKAEKKIKDQLKPTTTLMKSYSDKITNDKYIYHQSFSSFSLNKDMILKFSANQQCCGIKSKLEKNTPYLYVYGKTKEYEVLFPLFSKFEVINRSLTNPELKYLGSSYNISDDDFIYHVKYFIEFEKSDEIKFLKKYPQFTDKLNKFYKDIEEYYKTLPKNGILTGGSYDYFSKYKKYKRKYLNLINHKRTSF